MLIYVDCNRQFFLLLPILSHFGQNSEEAEKPHEPQTIIC